jgi:uncharacterized protein
VSTRSLRLSLACRSRITALLLVQIWVSAACSSGAAASRPQELTLWSGIAANFTRDLIERLNAAHPQTHIRLQTTSGGVVVVSAVDEGRGELGLTQSDVVYLAYRRGIERNLYPHKNLRAIAVLWVNNIYVLVRRDSRFRSITDLRGQRVGIIVPGTSGEFSTRIVLSAYGMSYSDVTPVFEPTEQIVPKLGRGELDAAFSANPVIVGAVREVNQTVPLRLLPISRSVINRLRGSYPFLKPVTVAANQLSGHTRPIETLGAEWVLVCRSDLAEDLVYELTKSFFAQLPALARAHAEAALIDPEQAPATPIPLHPGAARYYREREVLK